MAVSIKTMNSNLDVNHFKSELSDYYWLKSKIAKIEDLKLQLEVKRGIKSPRFDVECVQGSSDPLQKELSRLEDIDQAEYLDQEYIKYSKKLDRITNFLRSSSVGDSIMRIHCLNKSTYAKEAKLLYMGEKTLKRRVIHDITEYLKKEEIL